VGGAPSRLVRSGGAGRGTTLAVHGTQAI